MTGHNGLSTVPVCLYVCLSVCVSVCLYVCVSVCLSVSVYVCVVMAARLLESIEDMRRVIMDSAQFLLTRDKTQYAYSDAAPIFDVVRISTNHNI